MVGPDAAATRSGQRHRLEAREPSRRLQHALRDITTWAVLGAGADDRLGGLTSLVAATLPVDLAVVATCREGDLAIRATTPTGADTPARALVAAVGLRACREDRAILDPGARHRVAFPLSDGMQAHGVLAVSGPRPLTPDEHDWLDAVATIAASIHLRAEAEQSAAERIKELTAIGRVARAAQSTTDPATMARHVADALVAAFQYPEITGAVAALDGSTATSGAESLACSLAVDVVVAGIRRGSITVGYREPAPFLAEEHELLETISESVGTWLAGRDADRDAEHNRIRMTRLYEHSLDAIIVFDPQGRHLDVNPAARDLLGLPAVGPVAGTLADHLAPAERPRLEEMRSVLRDVGQWSGDLALRDRSGEPRLVEARVVAHVLPDVHLATIRDVTAERHAAQGLRESEDRLARVVETLAEGLITFSADGVVTQANPEACRLLGIDDPTGSRLAGMTDVSVRGADGAPIHPDAFLAEVMAQSSPLRGIEVTLRRTAGPPMTLLVNVSPVVDAEGSTTGAVVSFQDVTAQHEAEIARQQALERERQAAEDLRRLDQLKTAFLQAVSHEIRTPLTSVRGFGAVLSSSWRELSDAKRDDLLERLCANTARLESLLSDLLDLDRLERGFLELHPGPVDVSQLTLRVLESLDDETAGRVRVRCEPVTAQLDGPRIERVVESLVLNALRHTPADTPVDVVVLRDDDRVVVRVSDRGPGVPEHLRDHVFEPFTLGPTPAATVGGAGLGLATARANVDLHGGRLWVQDRSGGGAEFVMALPLEPAPPRHDSCAGTAAEPCGQIA